MISVPTGNVIVSNGMSLSLIALAALCVFDVAAGAYGAKVDLISFLDPIRAEARPMGGVERVPIIDKTVEQGPNPPGLDTHNVGLRKNSVLFMTMVPIRTNNEFRKISVYSVVQSPIRDWIGKYHKVCPQMRQECWAVADVLTDHLRRKVHEPVSADGHPSGLSGVTMIQGLFWGPEDTPLPPRDNRVDACRKGGDERYVNCRPRGGWWPHPLLLGIALLPTCIFSLLLLVSVCWVETGTADSLGGWLYCPWMFRYYLLVLLWDYWQHGLLVG